MVPCGSCAAAHIISSWRMFSFGWSQHTSNYWNEHSVGYSTLPLKVFSFTSHSPNNGNNFPLFLRYIPVAPVLISMTGIRWEAGVSVCSAPLASSAFLGRICWEQSSAPSPSSLTERNWSVLSHPCFPFPSFPLTVSARSSHWKVKMLIFHISLIKLSVST